MHNIPIDQINRLARLTDLSRIKWVNHTFAYVLYEAGYQSAEQVAKADSKDIDERLKKLNSERKFYRHNIGENDMKRCIQSARILDFEIGF